MYACMHVCMHVCMYVRMYVCMYVCMYVWCTSGMLQPSILFVCMHIHTYIHLVIQYLVYCIHLLYTYILNLDLNVPIILNLQEMLIDFDKNSDDMVSLEEYVGKCMWGVCG